MRASRLWALHGYRRRRWSVAKPSVLIPNLLKRQFAVTRRNKAWVTDITYIRTWQGWLYLAVILDLFSRKIVEWSTRPTIHRGGDQVSTKPWEPQASLFVAACTPYP